MLLQKTKNGKSKGLGKADRTNFFNSFLLNNTGHKKTTSFSLKETNI